MQIIQIRHPFNPEQIPADEVVLVMGFLMEFIEAIRQ